MTIEPRLVEIRARAENATEGPWDFEDCEGEVEVLGGRMSEPCKCHQAFARVIPFHTGHCCFFPESQNCHQDEVAEWIRCQEALTTAREDQP